MLFNSPFFLLLFLPLFLIFYFLMPGIRLRNMLIVVFSVVFFAWGDPIFIEYVIAGTWIDYLIIKKVLSNPNRSEQLKKGALILAILLNVAALLFFKYANFFIDQFEPLFHLTGISKPSWYPVALPLGISFIAFHKISFMVDLYKHRTAPPASFVDALVYILFFPQLIAGPIVRYQEINQQIRLRLHSSEDFLAGMFRFTCGLGKKVLIADPCGEIANTVFALAPGSLPVYDVWIGAIAYTIQIYFDFSGYSDMAIGLARIVGFKFPENFNQPYLAKSVTEFWQRWHMTLSNWMRLYLYIPLGGNRVQPWRMYLNLWIVFLISGFWHGASWTFIVWGAYYGFFLTIEKFCSARGWVPTIPNWMKRLFTLFIIINAWVLFRASSLEYAWKFMGRMLGVVPQSMPTSQPLAVLFADHDLATLIIGVLIALIPSPQWLLRFATVEESISIDVLRWVYGNTLFLTSVASIMAYGSTTFLYFHF